MMASDSHSHAGKPKGTCSVCCEEFIMEPNSTAPGPDAKPISVVGILLCAHHCARRRAFHAQAG